VCEHLIVVGELAAERKPARGAIARPCVDCQAPLWITSSDDIVLLEAGAAAACKPCALRGVLREACAPTIWRSPETFEAAFGLCTGDLPNPPTVEAAFVEAHRPN
jgi:hypothetical protein